MCKQVWHAIMALQLINIFKPFVYSKDTLLNMLQKNLEIELLVPDRWRNVVPTFRSQVTKANRKYKTVPCV